MQPYNSGRMLIHGHRQDKSGMGVRVLLLQISMCVLHVCFACKCIVYFFRWFLSVYILVDSLQVYVSIWVKTDMHAMYSSVHVCTYGRCAAPGRSQLCMSEAEDP